MKKYSAILAGFLVAILAVSYVKFPVSAVVPGSNTLVTMKHDNTQARSVYSGGQNRMSFMSRDGKFVIFFTGPTDDALATPVATKQLVIRDLTTNTNQLASVNTAGQEVNADIDDAAISENGRFIVFGTRATNITSGTSGGDQVYIRDRVNNTTTIASITSSGTVANNTTRPQAVSNDGRFVLIYSIASTLGASGGQILLKDMQTGDLNVISKSAAGVIGNLGASRGVMSCDGSFVAFSSAANNLVPNDTNTNNDVFLADLRNGFSIKQLTPNASSTASITDMSCNGTFLTFQSPSQNITSDTVTGTYTHSYIYNRLSDSISIVDKNYYNGQIPPRDTVNPVVSDNGHVVFTSISPGGGDLAASPAPGNKNQVYIRDTEAGVTQMLSVTSSNGASNNNSGGIQAITSDGSKAAYYTTSTNLSSTTDANNANDLYISATGY
jgi:hypothetical protein